MDEEERGPKLSKRFTDNKDGEVDYKTKSGTAWSHNFLNQKPWHPLSYPNQRRKWIAEQTHAQRDRRAEEVAREYAQEQEFFRQTALVSKKEKEKMEMMKAVSFMYIRPPGYDPESAKAAEIAENTKKQEADNPSQDPASNADSAAMPSDLPAAAEEKKKKRVKDIYGRALPTEEQFDILKNAPRMDTGMIARARPFGIEIRNVKCLRCGNYGHQSGDRECPLKDTIMPNEESRLKRDDPLTVILDRTDASEPLKWELKQKPGMSPPRGGFDPDDPNQQIVAEDIFDEYGGFLSEQNIPELLANFSSSKSKNKKSSSKRKHKRLTSPHIAEIRDREEEKVSSDSDGRRKSKKREENKAEKKQKRKLYEADKPEDSGVNRRHRSRSKRRYPSSSESTDSDLKHRHKQSRSRRHSCESSSSDEKHRHKQSRSSRHLSSFESSDSDGKHQHKQSRSKRHHPSNSELLNSGRKHRHKHSRSKRHYSSPETSDSIDESRQ
ncbi:hypothetical protein DCAR_0935865 [Daucus carota subsp. sativus]|uniref:Uncharacterized protein n=1 Tax=Daucus carota subsp. sativus TaxID=79200 RepID=A0A175YIZ2_DAUCS|nr:PREDICTED: uncharacterized zinc finger CCHC domain-containing protein At4g19190 [Daucus carota subsp. sativus]WOH16314.1 hypothetical protein DCAR_0935865 [Daucus carota subsp. sativus]